MALPFPWYVSCRVWGRCQLRLWDLSVWQLLPEGKRHPIALSTRLLLPAVHQNQNLVDLVLTATWQDSIRKASAHNATLGTTAQPMRCGGTNWIMLSGFYCLAGQNVSTPRNPYSSENTTSDVCPPGSYCPGTVLPIDCPVGTFNPRRRYLHCSMYHPHSRHVL